MVLKRKRNRLRRDRSEPAGGFARSYSGSPKTLSGADNLTAEAIELWQGHAERPLTLEDGREIIENLTGFFGLLEEWRFAEQVEEVKNSKRADRTKSEQMKCGATRVDHG